MSSSSSTTSTLGRAFIRDSYHPESQIPAPPLHPVRVARILICEPHDDISALLELVVRRLGHEPVQFAGGEVDHIGIHAAVVEPGEAAALRVARGLRAQNVPVLFTSIYPPDAD